jgi:sulfide:quinone oxidoreductase
MTAPGRSADEPLDVLVAGGGIAGLETLVALRGLSGHGVALTLVAPEADFTIRALEVFEPFGLGPPHRYPLTDVAADLDADFHRDTVARVDPDRHRVRLASGTELGYDVLVLAVGALPYPAFEHGTCFARSSDPQDFDDVLADLRAGLAERVAVVAPAGAPWTLPAYELALMIAAFVERSEVTVVTPEHEPLSAFGAPAVELVRGDLRAAGVELLTGISADLPHPSVVQLTREARLSCDRIVHLPLLSGPNTHGVTCDGAGFIIVDDGFRVRGTEDVFAVGDGATGVYKQGGLAAQQADAVAEQIAWRAGAEHPPHPYRPVLRAMLRTVNGPRYLRAQPPGGDGDAEVSDECLWWPPSKVAARWLTPWLASRELEARPLPPPRRLGTGGISRTTDR